MAGLELFAALTDRLRRGLAAFVNPCQQGFEKRDVLGLAEVTVLALGAEGLQQQACCPGIFKRGAVSGVEFDKRRRYAHAKLNSIPGITCVNAKGAFYLFPNIAQTGLKSAEFCARLLDAEKVAAVPGIAFGADDYIRLSYATGLANIEKGLDRLDKFCRTLVR